MTEEERNAIRFMVDTPGWKYFNDWIEEERDKLCRIDDLVSIESQGKALDNTEITHNIKKRVTQICVYRRIINTIEEWANGPGGIKNA